MFQEELRRRFGPLLGSFGTGGRRGLFPQHDWQPSLFGESACRGKEHVGAMMKRAKFLKQCDGAAVGPAQDCPKPGRCLGPGLF